MIDSHGAHERLRHALLRGSLALRGDRVVEVSCIEPNPYGSSNETYVAGVTTDSGRHVELLAKFGRGNDRTRIGDPRGALYEGHVYASALDGIPAYASPFVAVEHDGAGVWLLVEWLDAAVRVSKCEGDAAMLEAATWLGAFHRTTVGLVATPRAAGLIDYSASSIARWTRSAWPCLEECSAVDPELDRGLDDIGNAMELLQRSPTMLIHGDLYPENVLVAAGRVVPIDWERAGIGPGEIDLAALIDGWPRATADACIASYLDGRWPDGISGDERTCFDDRLAAARAFLALRWIGLRGDRVSRIPHHWRGHLLGARLGAQGAPP